MLVSPLLSILGSLAYAGLTLADNDIRFTIMAANVTVTKGTTDYNTAGNQYRVQFNPTNADLKTGTGDEVNFKIKGPGILHKDDPSHLRPMKEDEFDCKFTGQIKDRNDVARYEIHDSSTAPVSIYPCPDDDFGWGISVDCGPVKLGCWKI